MICIPIYKQHQKKQFCNASWTWPAAKHPLCDSGVPLAVGWDRKLEEQNQKKLLGWDKDTLMSEAKLCLQAEQNKVFICCFLPAGTLEVGPQHTTWYRISLRSFSVSCVLSQLLAHLQTSHKAGRVGKKEVWMLYKHCSAITFMGLQLIKMY